VSNVRQVANAALRIIDFSRMIKRVARRHGTQAAIRWARAVLAHQAVIDEAALRIAIRAGSVSRIETAIRTSQLQQNVQIALQAPLLGAAVGAGQGGAAILQEAGFAATFNASHPNVVLFARTQAADLVVGIPRETRTVIRMVLAAGKAEGLTVVQQATAIREVVGLPPNWAQAPLNLAAELRAGDAAAATARRLSAVARQEIRSRIARGTITDSFIERMTKQYSDGLINRRAQTIARTESARAAHFGLHEEWDQALKADVLPANARQFWIVTPDDRLSLAHERIPGMNPEGRGLMEMFFTPDGVFPYPPTRPNCRCSVGLGFPGAGALVA